MHVDRPIKRPSELKDFLAFLVLYAPDEFPEWRDLTLEKALVQLVDGIEACKAKLGSAENLAKLKSSAAEAAEAYRCGNVVAGAHTLQDMMRLL
jgi:hypothetical protein